MPGMMSPTFVRYREGREQLIKYFHRFILRRNCSMRLPILRMEGKSRGSAPGVRCRAISVKNVRFLRSGQRTEGLQLR
jgi:hypothetical protein